jgi:hypothetical protein
VAFRHACLEPGYLRDMGEREHTKQPVEERRPLEAQGLPEEEEVSRADVADRVDEDPDGQLNRPDQPDFDESEREQYENPPVERPIADADRPEDR